MSNFAIPGGNNRGTPLHEATDNDLQYWAKRLGEEISAGKSQNKERDVALHKAMLDEIAARESGQRRPPARQNGKQQTSLAVRDLGTITGSFRDPDIVTAHMQRAAKNYHLVSPSPACPRLPEGCGVGFSAVMLDPENECYRVGDKLALGKTALERISTAAGISWDAAQSGRLDDGSDPHYCAWKAVGTMRHMDGTEIQLLGSKEMDMREGSAQIQALWDQYEAKLAKWERDKRGKRPNDPTARIRETRLHIMAHAESKARLRAIRSLGIRSSYSPPELQKPFVVAKLMWTGESDDPELRHEFAKMNAAAMLGGVRALYGERPSKQTAPALPRHAPPPVGSVPMESEEYPIDDSYDHDTGEVVGEGQQELY